MNLDHARTRESETEAGLSMGSLGSPCVISRSEHPISRKMMDEEVLKVLYRLKNQGHTAYLCGGSVRDLLCGVTPKDFDVATDARPGQLRKIFANSWAVGKRFRIIHVVFKGGKVIEVSTFRKESEFNDGPENSLMLRPDNTYGNPQEDALRRDFSINALYYNISDFSIIDYVGGMEDIRRRIIRSIGDPDIRFQEDPIRILRGIRFASNLDFGIESRTWEMMRVHADKVPLCPPSRIQEDLLRFLRKSGIEQGFRRMDDAGLLTLLLPELSVIRDSDGKLPGEFFRILASMEELRRGMEAPPSDALLWACVLILPALKRIRALAHPVDDLPTEIHNFLSEPGTRLNIPKAVRNHVKKFVLSQDYLDPDRPTLRKGWLRLFRSGVFEEAFLLARIVAGPGTGREKNLFEIRQTMEQRSAKPSSERRPRKRSSRRRAHTRKPG
jgi:poly(A) polymerase